MCFFRRSSSRDKTRPLSQGISTAASEIGCRDFRAYRRVHERAEADKTVEKTANRVKLKKKGAFGRCLASEIARNLNKYVPTHREFENSELNIHRRTEH